jgi:hypothetical protein
MIDEIEKNPSDWNKERSRKVGRCPQISMRIVVD